MAEWWTYSLSDFLLFSPRTYYRQLELHNAAVWPAQLLALTLGLAALALLRLRPPWHGRAVAAILAAAWVFTGWAYHLERYAAINWGAEYFAWGYFAEAVLIAAFGIGGDGMRTAPRAHGAARAGVAIFVFALVFYPLVAVAMGRPWSQAEVFAVAPDPTAAATMGLLLAAERTRWPLLVLPLLWCAVSGATLAAMASPEAPLIAALGLLALVLAVRKSRR